MNLIKKLLFGFVVVFLSNDLHAQVKFTAGVNRNKVRVGEQFQISFSIGGNGSNFKAPNFNDFQVLAGPSTSTNMSIVNGSFSQSVSYTYYLAAKKEGTLIISPASIIIDGKKVESNSVQIEVSKGAPQQPSNSNPNQQNGRQGTNNQASNEISDNLFVKASVDKNSVYVGEQLVVTYKLYRRVDILQYQVNEMPKYNGFWKEELKTTNETHTESIDGIQYAVTDIKKVLLFPQKGGNLMVDPLDLTCLVRVKGKRQNNIFDDFFGIGGYQDVKQQISCKPVKINVIPLPSNKPDDFNGAVGKFSLIGKADKTKLKANDAVNYKIVVSGKGNLKLIDPPKIELPESIEAYEPKTIDNINVTATGISGSRSFEYLIIPRAGGKFTIPAVSFSYFDIDKNSFQTLSTDVINLEVDGPKNQNLGTVLQNNSVQKQEVKVSENNVRYIKVNSQITDSENTFYRTILFWILFFIPIFGFGFFALTKDKFFKEKSEFEIKMKRAAKVAILQLNKPKDANTTEIIIYNILSEYLKNKFNIPQAQLDKTELQKIFSKNDQLVEVGKKIIKLLNELEMSKYSPIGSSSNINTAETAKEIILKIEELT